MTNEFRKMCCYVLVAWLGVAPWARADALGHPWYSQPRHEFKAQSSHGYGAKEIEQLWGEGWEALNPASQYMAEEADMGTCHTYHIRFLQVLIHFVISAIKYIKIFLVVGGCAHSQIIGVA